METRQLGNSDLYITSVGFGTWALPPICDAQSVAVIHRALELGVNWIDTAPQHAGGESVVAHALESWPGPRPHVFTQYGLWAHPGPEPPYWIEPQTPDNIRDAFEESLRRLRVDVIDLYQIGWNSVGNAAVWRTMAALQREGKVRWIGISETGAPPLWTTQPFQVAQLSASVTSLLAPYLSLDSEAQREISPYCEASGIGVLAYLPLGGALLAGGKFSYEAGAVLTTGGMARERRANDPDGGLPNDPRFAHRRIYRNLDLAEEFQRIGRGRGCSGIEVAVAWTLRLPSLTGLVVGAEGPEQMEMAVRGADLKLSPDEIERIEAVLRR